MTGETSLNDSLLFIRGKGRVFSPKHLDKGHVMTLLVFREAASNVAAFVVSGQFPGRWFEGRGE